jgi:hypothetical protein
METEKKSDKPKNKYECFMPGKRGTFEAATTWEAQQVAGEAWKVPKKKWHSITPILVEKDDGTSVSVDPASL